MFYNQLVKFKNMLEPTGQIENFKKKLNLFILI